MSGASWLFGEFNHLANHERKESSVERSIVGEQSNFERPAERISSGLRRLSVRRFGVGVLGLLFVVVGYTAHRQGVFSPQREFILETRNGAGLRPGVAIELSGFEIGRVVDVMLNDKGIVEARVQVQTEHTRWLRADSRFRRDQPIVGSVRILVETPDLSSPLLPNAARRELLEGSQIASLVGAGQTLLADAQALVAALSAKEGDLQKTLASISRVAARIEQRGLLAQMLNNDAASQALAQTVALSPATIAQANRSFSRAEEAAREASGLLADLRQQLGPAGRPNAGSGPTSGVAPEKTTPGSGAVAATLLESRVALQEMREAVMELKLFIKESRAMVGEASSAAEGLDVLRTRADRIASQLDSLLRDLQRIGLVSPPAPPRLP